MTNRPSRLAYVLVRLVSVEVAAAGSGAVVIVVLVVVVVVVVVVVACVGLERFGGLGPCGFRMTSYRFLQLLVVINTGVYFWTMAWVVSVL